MRRKPVADVEIEKDGKVLMAVSFAVCLMSLGTAVLPAVPTRQYHYLRSVFADTTFV